VSEPRPLLSVVLRTFGHAPFIAQAIESVLLQKTDFPFELVVGEDCSTDGTREIVQAYARHFPDVIRPVLPERNIGHGEMLRRALAATRGELIAYLDGDDYWTSREKLAKQVAFLRDNPDCHDCFHDVSLVYDEAGVPSGAVSPRLAEEHFGIEQILMECFVPAPAMMFRRGVFEELEREAFDSAWLDWIIHVQAATHGPLGYLPETLAAYRVHRGGMFSALDRVSQLKEDDYFYARLLRQLPDQRGLIERCLAHRRAQLAIERLGVPFEACVVLAEPRHEFRPYFNGRHARSLPRREGREVTELRAIREASATLAPAVEDYGSGIPPAEGPQGCFLVVPGPARAWLEEHKDLCDYLAREGRIAWEDEWVAVYELEPLAADGGRGGAREVRRRVSVQPLRGISPAELPAAFLEAPADGALLPAHAVMVAGWVVGDDGPAAAIEFEYAGEVVWRTPLGSERSDVVAAFPDAAVGRPGFQTTLNVCDLPPEAEVMVFALFAGGRRAAIANLILGEPDEGVEAGGDG
jgi:glycosyltransferase involved in cell wall biosynthesis